MPFRNIPVKHIPIGNRKQVATAVAFEPPCRGKNNKACAGIYSPNGAGLLFFLLNGIGGYFFRPTILTMAESAPFQGSAPVCEKCLAAFSHLRVVVL